MKRALVRGAVAVASLVCLLSHVPSVHAASPIAISQVYGGGGNSGATLRNDYVELFNRGSLPVDVSGWSVQYASASGSTWQRTNLVGSIPPGGHYLVQEAQGSGGTVSLPTPDAAGTIAMSATAGKVVLMGSQITVASGTLCPAGADVIDLVGFGSANCYEGNGPTGPLSNTSAALRLVNGCTDGDSNAADFAVGAPNPRNSASPVSLCLGGTSPSAQGQAAPAVVPAGAATSLTVTVLPGANPPSSGLSVTADLSALGGSATQALYDDGSNGDASVGDLVFTYQVSIPSGTAPGSIVLPVSVRDAELRQTDAVISLSIAPPPLPIHAIQGNGPTSPHVGELVTVRGIVTGRKTSGFFVQSRDGEQDGDPETSEGLFVYTGATPPADAAVASEVLVTGTVQEYVPSGTSSLPLTELVSPVVSLVATEQPLPEPVTLTAADTDPAGDRGQLERFEGMRVRVDSLTVVGPTDGTVIESQARSTSNGVFYGVISGVARPFREPGIEVGEVLPADAPCCIPRFDGNPERLRVDSDGLVGAARFEVASGDVLDGIVGVLDYGSGSYTILPEPGTPAFVTQRAAMPLVTPLPSEFTVASYNLERFFDTTDDPGTSDPVLSDAAFEIRLSKASLVIRKVLASPDILGLQEVENLATLETLAARLNADAIAAGVADPQYAAFLQEGNDPGGIDAGLLVKTARVSVVDVVQAGKDATYVNPLNGENELLNDRPPLVLRALVHRQDGPDFPLTVIVNHLRSLSGINDPADGPRVRAKRRAQAEYLANLIQARRSADPDEHLIVLGDMNAYQFNDGYVDTLATIRGVPTSADEVILASPDLVEPNLVDASDGVPAAERYSYVFEGNAQQLDHMLLSANLAPRLTALRHGRLDADFPESLRGDASRPERLSDHDPLVAYFTFPPDVPPTADAGPDRTVPADADGVARVTLAAQASDPDGDALTITWQGPFGTASGATTEVALGLGAHEILLTVDDGRGSVTTDTVVITVSDVTPPRIVSLSASPAVLWPPRGQFVPVSLSVDATDAAGSPRCRIVGVTSDEPSHVFSGALVWLNWLFRDWWITSDLSLLLRAERSPWGNGRTYSVAVQCSDASGNTSGATTTVLVPRRRSK